MEELVHRQHQGLRLLSSVPWRAEWQDPHHCQVRCLVHQCMAAPPKTAPEMGCFLWDSAVPCNRCFFIIILIFSKNRPDKQSYIKGKKACKSRIKGFLVLWDTIHSSHSVAADAQGSSSLAPTVNGWVCACYSISPTLLCKKLLFWASVQHSDCKGQKARNRSINYMFQSTTIIMLCTEVCSSFNEMRVKALRPEGVEIFNSQMYTSCIPMQHKSKINH